MSQLTLIDINWVDIIYSRIFNLLTMQDLFNLRACSNAYKLLVDEYFMKFLTNLNDKSLSRDQFVVLANICQNIRHINLSNYEFLTDNILKQLFENNVNIQLIKINNCKGDLTSQSLWPVVYKLKKLTKLHLVDCPWISEGFLDCFMQHHDNMEEFCVSGRLNVSEACIRNLANQYNGLLDMSVTSGKVSMNKLLS